MNVELTMMLPSTRADNTVLLLADIASVTVSRDSGAGPLELAVLPGPFTEQTVLYTDTASVTDADAYSFFVTDKDGIVGAESEPAVMVVPPEIVPPAALPPPKAGTLTAVAAAVVAAPAVAPAVVSNV
jgi:hypothetical protein